jgi:hypothetical protein
VGEFWLIDPDYFHVKGNQQEKGSNNYNRQPFAAGGGLVDVQPVRQ